MFQASVYGRLGQQPRPIDTATGKTMAVASIAVNVPIGKTTDTATAWFDLLAFGRLAEQLLNHDQGDLVAVMGGVRLNQWTDHNGTVQERQQIRVEALVSARTTRPGGGRKPSNPPEREAARQPNPEAERVQVAAGPDDFDDELPF